MTKNRVNLKIQKIVKKIDAEKTAFLLTFLSKMSEFPGVLDSTRSDYQTYIDQHFGPQFQAFVSAHPMKFHADPAIDPIMPTTTIMAIGN